MVANSSKSVNAPDDATPHDVTLDLLPGESWWGGKIADGVKMPFTAETNCHCDLGDPGVDGHGLGLPSNQVAPILLSNKGRCVVSADMNVPFDFRFENGNLKLTGAPVRILGGEDAGAGLAQARALVAKASGEPRGLMPASAMLEHPHYNTWIEMPVAPTQEKVLAYVRDLLDGGMPPGLVIIDDNWARNHGELQFDAGRFPDPRGMCEQLHEWGCRVMLWLVPFISPDSAVFRQLREKGLLLRGADGKVAIREWWNGFSALLDLSNPNTLDWVENRLRDLQNEFGVDGFKFDGGDMRDYLLDDATHAQASPQTMSLAWAQLASRFPFNEVRACWAGGGLPLAQRLEDKPPSWSEYGIGSLIPNMLAQGLAGYPYSCPDMIGGGEICAMSAQQSTDQEFFVRYAQVAALSPMMQFSVSPRRVLDDKHFGAVMNAIELRQRFTPLILELAQNAAQTGQPIIRPLAWIDGELGRVQDQFLLGDSVLVAPVIKQGQRSRTVVLPGGAEGATWEDGNTGTRYEVEPNQSLNVEVDAPVEVLPFFIRH